MGVPAQFIQIVIQLDAQIPERLGGCLLDNSFNIDLPLFAALFAHPNLHQRHRQTAAMGPGVVAGKLPHIKVDVVPRTVFRQRQTVAVEDQAARRRQQNRNRRLVNQALGMLLPFDNLDDEEALQEDAGRQHHHQHGRLHAAGNVGHGTGEQHQRILRPLRAVAGKRSSCSSHQPITTEATPLAKPARTRDTLRANGQSKVRVSSR